MRTAIARRRLFTCHATYLHPAPGRVDVEPVTGDVDGHGQLKQEHEAGVEGGQGGEEAHGGAPVRQHVQHGPKLAALVQQSGSMTVQGIQKTFCVL